jgi:succinylarginine dihydrolase
MSPQARAHEANFDGLVGPTHHYAGLSVGNVASVRNAKIVSQPKRAALQGIAKAALLRDLGLKQGILPPLRRPRLDTLRALGYAGSDASVIERAFRAVPHLVSACYSASAMWVANAATFSPSADAEDGKAHFTAANLSSKFHRSLEPRQTAANLRAIFGGARSPEESLFVHHDPVFPQFGDEGAANHGRLAPSHGAPGVEVFVFGGSTLQDATFPKPKRYPARQTIEASHAVSTNHRLDPSRVAILQQNPDAIDAGVFHNDVVSVMNENAYLVHERTFLDQAGSLARLRELWGSLPGTEGKPLSVIEIADSEVPLEDAIRSYLFNSQLISLPEGGMALVCPEESRETPSVKAALDRILGEKKTPITKVMYLDVRESMQNGGGPACLRLRVSLTDAEAAQVHPSAWLTAEREHALIEWVQKHYRDRLAFDDLRDPKLFLETQAAMDDLERQLGFVLA